MLVQLNVPTETRIAILPRNKNAENNHQLRRLRAVSAVVVHAQTGVEGKNDLNTALQIKLDEWHKAGSFPGATLGVVLANGESFGLAVGFSDRESRTPMKPTDRMLAGSVGKTFAGATALQLIKEGKIGLDDKIEKYLGREPWFSRPGCDVLP